MIGSHRLRPSTRACAHASSRPRSLCLGISALGLLSFAPLGSADQPLDPLEIEIEERLDELDALPLLTPEQLDEAKGLDRARSALDGYRGSLDSYAALDLSTLEAFERDLNLLQIVARSVEDSETLDGGVLQEVDAIRDLLNEFGIQTSLAAGAKALTLIDDSVEEDVLTFLEQGESAREFGFRVWSRNYGQGATVLASSVLLFLDGLLLGVQQQEEEVVEEGVDQDPTDVIVPDVEPIPFEPFTVEAQISLAAPTPQLTLAVRAVEQATPSGGGEGTAPLQEAMQATVGIETLLDLPAGDLTCPVEVAIEPFAEEQQLQQVADPGSPNPLGVATDSDLEGDLAVVGYPGDPGVPGSSFVAVFDRFEGGFNEWGRVATLTYPGSSAGESARFGDSVALSGDTILVGAPGDTVAGTSVGSVFVYERDGDGNWQVVQTLRTEDPIESRFGEAVEISGERLVVGAPDWPTQSQFLGSPHEGQVFAYERSGPPTDPWVETSPVVEYTEWTTKFAGAYLARDFGEVLAMDGDMLVIGDPTGCGIAGFYSSVFVAKAVGSEWPLAEVDQINSLPPCGSDAFGVSLDCDASSRTVAIGIADQTGFSGGSAEIYREMPGTSSFQTADWELLDTVQAPVALDGERFGDSLTLSEGTLVVGASAHTHPYGGTANAGSVYVFVEGHRPGCPPQGDPDGWGLLARRTALEPAADGRFGVTVASHEDTILVGGKGTIDTFTGMSPMKAGFYQLVIQVDPLDQVLELDETGDLIPEDAIAENMVASVDDENEPISVEFCVPALDQPDLRVTFAELVPAEEVDEDLVGFIVADQSGNQLTKAGVNVAVELLGSFEGQLTGAVLRTQLVVSEAGGPVPQGTVFPGQFWDPALGMYVNEIPIPDIIVGDQEFFSRDTRYTGVDVAGLASYGVDLEVRAVIPNTFGVTDIDESNNLLVRPNQNYTQIQVVSCDFYEQWSTKMGNDDMNVGIDIEGSLGLFGDTGGNPLVAQPGHSVFNPLGEGVLGTVNQATKGALGSLNAGATLTLLGADFGDLARFRGQVERDPSIQVAGFDEPGYGYIGFDVFYLNPADPFGFLDVIFSWGPYDSTVIKEIEEFLPEGLEVTDDGGFKLTRDFSVDKEVSQTKQFVVAGVPIDVTAAAMGEIGVELAFEVSNDVKFDVTPALSSGVSLSIAVGDCDLICGGAKGELTIIEDELSIASGLLMHYVKNEAEIAGEIVVTQEAICATSCFTIDNVVSMLDGKIYAFAIVPWVDICWETIDPPFLPAFEIPYPCKFYQKEFQEEIVSWSGFEFENELVDIANSLCSVQIVGGFDCESVTSGDNCGIE